MLEALKRLNGGTIHVSERRDHTASTSGGDAGLEEA